MEEPKKSGLIFSVDPGDKKSGFVILVDGVIKTGGNIDNNLLPAIIRSEKLRYKVSTMVIIEDIAAFSDRLKTEVIGTCKYIGWLTGRLELAGIAYTMLYRWQVQKWCYDAHTDVAMPLIEKRIDVSVAKKKKKSEESGDQEPIKRPSATFVWVNDRVVGAIMRHHWGIDRPKPGKSNQYGISTHAWQALGVATAYLNKK